MKAALIYPHQLFEPSPALVGMACVFIVEEPLFFTQYAFHRQKLLLHRASMQRYADHLRQRKHTVHYLEAAQLPTTGHLVEHLRSQAVTHVRVVDPCDDWLTRRLQHACQKAGITLELLDDPHFLTPTNEIDRFTSGKQKLFFTEFYIAQRQRLKVLLANGKPIGGQWSFDPENRKKLPKTLTPPAVAFPAEDRFTCEARSYVRQNFPNALGHDEPFRYPIDHTTARQWLRDFVQQRLEHFGAYEDAISTQHEIIFHSVLTPMLNIGLVSPAEVLAAVLEHVDRVPLNSLEGFVRQVVGWREFIRLVYRVHGRRQRTTNSWGFTRKLPASFYTGTTGITPVDQVIQQLLRTGYCHHIERLMIVGNFMLLCEIHPDDVYRWFMEMFIDAYDWVMVPNVYGMSQHADGGFMTTKPYISGSSYVLKMSNHTKGPWCAIWDALYWRFIHTHRDFFAGNPRMAVMVQMSQKLGPKLQEHLRTADAFLNRLA